MGYSNRYSGMIVISPPLGAPGIREAPASEDDAWNTHLRITSQTVQTDMGEATLYTADAIVGPDEDCSGYDVEKQITALARYCESLGRTLVGWIQVDWDAGLEEMPTRYVWRDGALESVRPTMTWPGMPDTGGGE